MATLKVKKKIVDPVTGGTTIRTTRLRVDERHPSSHPDFHTICNYIGLDEYDRHDSRLGIRVAGIFNFFASKMKDPSPEKVYAEIRTFMRQKMMPPVQGKELVDRLFNHIRLAKIKQDEEMSEEQRKANLKDLDNKLKEDSSRAKDLRDTSKTVKEEADRSKEKAFEDYNRAKKESVVVKQAPEIKKLQQEYLVEETI